LAVLLLVAGYVTLRQVTGPSGAPCDVDSGDRQLALQQEQAANAATIGAVAVSRGLPRRALTIALATAMQESSLRDLAGGDRDSVGLFQQRPSQGWGTRAQIMDPVYATDRFFDALVKIPGYAELPLTTAAQRVQRSGFPEAYAKHEADASLLATALYGPGPRLNCRVVADDTPGDPAVVTRALDREFAGPVRTPYRVATPVGGTAKGVLGGPDDTVVVPGDGRGDDVVTGHGWALAQWAVAQAPKLRITEVDYRGRAWRAADSEQGWTADADRSAHPYDDVRIRVQR
jgi:hypothetical protein